MLMQVNAALFPNISLLAISEQSIRSVTLTVAVTHPGTNTNNCCLTSDIDLTASHIRFWIECHKIHYIQATDQPISG